MADTHLPTDAFFTRLTALLTSTHTKSHGSIHLTQKRLSYDSSSSSSADSATGKHQDDPLWDLHPPNPLPLIIRATDGKSQSKDRMKNKEKVKLSTIVQPEDLDAFYARYAEVLKAGMTGLKRRDRSKRRKGKKEGGGKKSA